MINLTPKVLDICKANYDKNCGGCPLRPKCVSNMGSGHEAYVRWVNGLNQLADGVEQEWEKLGERD